MNAQYQVMAAPTPRTKEMQDSINHLILGVTMWISATVTCVTTLLTVQQPWCLLALLIPFIYTMFPQIQRASTNAGEAALAKYKNKRGKKDDTKNNEPAVADAEAEPATLIELDLEEKVI